MSYFKLHPNDLFTNTVEAYPDVKFFIQSSSIYINDKNFITGTNPDGDGGAYPYINNKGVPRGFVSLYQYNVNRTDTERIYPFVIKDGDKSSFKSISTTDWNTQYNFGDQIISSYNLSSSISRYYITGSTVTSTPGNSNSRNNNYYLFALRNTLESYRYLSPAYAFSNYVETVITESDGALKPAFGFDNSAGGNHRRHRIAGVGPEVNLIAIPSIFYGSSIKKGSVKLKYYITGTLAAMASDYRQNGELVEVSASNNVKDTLEPLQYRTGSIIGTVLYKEGFLLLTDTTAIDSGSLDYETSTSSSWVRFGYGLPSTGPDIVNRSPVIGTTTLSASYSIEFQAVSQFQTLTVLATAPEGQLNNSNNPTFIKNSTNSFTNAFTSSYQYVQGVQHLVNVVPANYIDSPPPMKKETYISKIALYDKHKNVIGYAKLATPVRKTQDREFIFKLKLDL